MRTRELGISLFELLLSIALATPVLSLGAIWLHSSTKVVLQTQKTARELETLSQFNFHFQSALEALDGHPLDIPPRVHDAGTITFPDGENNRIMSSSKPPDSTAQSITFIELLTESSYVVKRLQNDTFTACPKYSAQFERHTKKSFAALSVDGIWELVESGRAVSLRNNCKNFILTPVKSMLLNGSASYDKRLIRLLIPITKLVTLYIDRNETLRYLSHRGENNIENQPLVHRIKDLNLELSRNSNLDIYSLSGNITLALEKNYSFEFSQRFPRESHLSLLVNHA